MFLIDTNIFLEILLKQEKSNLCKAFLENNIGGIKISDFSLHSIGVILFRQNEGQSFLKFISDILPKINLVSLPKNNYAEVLIVKNKIGLDFDDSYQYSICRQFNLKLATMDKDFKKVTDIEVQFI